MRYAEGGTRRILFTYIRQGSPEAGLQGLFFIAIREFSRKFVGVAVKIAVRMSLLLRTSLKRRSFFHLTSFRSLLVRPHFSWCRWETHNPSSCEKQHKGRKVSRYQKPMVSKVPRASTKPFFFDIIQGGTRLPLNQII